MSHSNNGPSSISRRKDCSASMQMELGMKDKENIFAQEGSAAHALGEKCLSDDMRPEEFIGQKMGEFKLPNGKIEEFIVDGDMIEAVQVYVDYCRPLINETTMIEKKIDINVLGPDENSKTGYVRGTSDFTSISDRILHVVDYKHGKGVPVDVIDNLQGLSYGIGASAFYEDEDWDIMRITIVQPRLFGGKPIKSWDVPKEDIIDWKMYLSSIAMKTFSDDVELTPTKSCRFCKALYLCKGIINLIKEITGMDLLKKDSDPMAINKLSDEQITDIIFNKLPIIKGWFSKLEDYAQQRAEERNPLPGTKLVETRKRRVWKDAGQAEQYFASKIGEKAYDKKFKTAPQIEKAVGKKAFKEVEEEFVASISSGVTLAPIDDPRQDVRPTAELEFGSVDLI